MKSLREFVQNSKPIQLFLLALRLGFQKMKDTIAEIPAQLTGFLFATTKTLQLVAKLFKDTFTNIKGLIAAAFDPTQSISDALDKFKGMFKGFGTEVSKAYTEGYLSVRRKQQKKELEMQKENLDEQIKNIEEFKKETFKAEKKGADLGIQVALKEAQAKTEIIKKAGMDNSVVQQKLAEALNFDLAS
jgi:hypothetical protein